MIHAKYSERLVPSTPAQVLAISGTSEDSGQRSDLQEGRVRNSGGGGGPEDKQEGMVRSFRCAGR